MLYWSIHSGILKNVQLNESVLLVREVSEALTGFLKDLLNLADCTPYKYQIGLMQQIFFNGFDSLFITNFIRMEWMCLLMQKQPFDDLKAEFV